MTPLREEDAYPADPEDGYGWEKLFSERQCRHYWEDFGLETRVVRFHNIFGPLGTYDGGREKSPAAICRKVAQAADGGEIEVWGDGTQTRSYCYVDDAVEGVRRLMRTSHREPLNVGQERLISINGLVDLVAGIAGKRIRRRHVPGALGVQGPDERQHASTSRTGMGAAVSLEEGLRRTYAWIAEQLAARIAARRRPRARPPVLRFVNLHYAPDVASTGQHLTDLAEHFGRAWYRCRGLIAAGGHYAGGRLRAPGHEVRNGVRVRRLPIPGFGRRSRDRARRGLRRVLPAGAVRDWSGIRRTELSC